MKQTQTYTWTRGQKLQLDDIYDVSGLGPQGEVDGWWQFDKDGAGEGGEDILITKDITITVIIDIKPKKK